MVQRWQALARQDPEEWFRRSVGFFQQMGYYQALSHLSGPRLVRQVAERMEAWIGGAPPVDPATNLQLADMFLLCGDGDRVWWRDLEVVVPGANAYAEVLFEWAQIARGALQLEEVSERWQAPEGPAEIVYRIQGETHRFVHRREAGDYLDVAILDELNRLLLPASYRFVVCDQGGLPNFVTVLTRAEQARLVQERGWDYYLPRQPA